MQNQSVTSALRLIFRAPRDSRHHTLERRVQCEVETMLLADRWARLTRHYAQTGKKRAG